MNVPGDRNGPQQGYNAGQYVAKNSFIYGTGFVAALLPASSTSSTFNIDGDSDFYWQKLNVHAVSADDATTYANELLPEVNIVITNTTTGRQYMNAAIPLANIAGTARLPFILPMVTYFPAKSTIKVEYQNVSDNATYSDLYLSFIGIKAFLG